VNFSKLKEEEKMMRFKNMALEIKKLKSKNRALKQKVKGLKVYYKKNEEKLLSEKKFRDICQKE